MINEKGVDSKYTDQTVGLGPTVLFTTGGCDANSFDVHYPYWIYRPIIRDCYICIHIQDIAFDSQSELRDSNS
ncbi:hypothetical protein GCM10008090_04870 [Arenicella chitinivorans]|uniref:Uncharacterized protein n=1 Tax=Arenicella chitinivorans TaxID=1329800 RepID=A0A918RHQ3_9GAMM|nr:hypothetical protein GCM10008090_04870 [Arenicella chitinivorans]